MKKIVVRHFHDGNDADRIFRGASPGHCAVYATQACVIETDLGVEFAEEWAYCNPSDTPSRAVGRLKAVRKLQGHWPEIVAGAEYAHGLKYLDIGGT